MTIMPPMQALALPAFLIATSLASASAAAKSDSPADYAYTLPLKLSGKQGVVGLPLPQAVYLKARTAELDDLRVFDAQGVAQPHAFYRPSIEAPAQQGALAAKIFPVRGASPAPGDGLPVNIDIRTRPDGSVQSVQARSGNVSIRDGDAVSSLILDFGPATKGDGNNPTRIEALLFSAPRGRNSYSAEVWLETSKDLKEWHDAGVAELNWLSNDRAQTLASDRLELGLPFFRYARLSWRQGEPILFPAIEAKTSTRRNSEPAYETLWIKPLPGRQAGDWVFPAGIALPVEQIRLKLQEANIVYPMALGYYHERPSRQAGKTTEWVFQPRSQATFYQITQDGQTRRSGAVSIDLAHQQEWVIRPSNAATDAKPELGLSWQAATLIFLAGGTPPYTLSFGRRDAIPVSRTLAQVAPGFTAAELKGLEVAQVGELQGGGSEVAAPSPADQAARAAQKPAFILWGVLLLGVATLFGMAWMLIRQLRASKEN